VDNDESNFGLHIQLGKEKEPGYLKSKGNENLRNAIRELPVNNLPILIIIIDTDLHRRN